MNLPLRHSSNEVTSGILHLIGAVLALAVFIVLVVLSALHGTIVHVIGFAVYGIGMVFLYLMSTLYHLMPHRKERAKDILQRIDHASVYLFIAATYTPVCFLVLLPPSNTIVLSILWVLACVGVFLKLAKVQVHYAIPLCMYLVMGWIIILFLPRLLEVMSTSALTLLIAGGISYTVGVIFFVMESKVKPKKYFWMHEIFHIFVLAGSILHTIMMFLLLYAEKN